MADQNEKTLNLDELFGNARAVKVIHDGREYELLRMEGISPKHLAKLQSLQKRAMAAQGRDLESGGGEMMEQMYDEMLGILCADLPLDTLAFAKKVRIMSFYIEETQGKKAVEATLKKLTGVKSSRS